MRSSRLVNAERRSATADLDRAIAILERERRGA